MSWVGTLSRWVGVTCGKNRELMVGPWGPVMLEEVLASQRTRVLTWCFTFSALGFTKDSDTAKVPFRYLFPLSHPSF